MFGTVPSEPLFSKERVLEEYIEEFVADWKMAGKAEQTARMYACHLTKFFRDCSDPTLTSAKVWLSGEASPSTRRKMGQALRAFGVFAENNEYEFFQWWKLVPLAKEKSFAQETVTEDMYISAKTKLKSLRDKALIETLWSCGLRRSELANLQVEDVNFSEGFLVVRTAKNGKPRVAPLSPIARRAIRKHLGSRKNGSLFQMSTNAIRLRLQRLDLPSAHAFRRGWAVQSLRAGVSETSVRAAAGWSSGAMVARYTQALSGELAVDEFQRSWAG